MTYDDIADVLRRYEAAVQDHDARVQAAFYAPDGVREGPAFGAVTGRAAIQKRYEYWYTAFPDLVLELEEMVIEGDRAAVFWKFQGTQQGPFLGLTGTGQRLVLPMVSLCRFKDEGIAYARYVYDFSGLLLKTGVLKAKPGQSPR